MPRNRVAELTREDVARIVDGLRCELPALGELRSDESGPYMPRTYYAAAPILEGAKFMRSWPDELDHIEPIDADDASAAVQWQFLSAPESPTKLGIITTIRLSEVEEQREGIASELTQLFAQRFATAQRYVEALAEQIQRFFDESLVDLGMDIVSQRRLTHKVVENLGFPQSWKIAPPKLIAEPPSRTNQPDDSVRDAAGQVTKAESTTTEHTVPHRHRLDPASFRDVQRVMRLWANSIQRYPAAFAALSEDRISDLLAATLNATLSGAQREVYSRAGKSDIFIQADVLAADSGPDKIFVCESKWSKSKTWVSEAIDPQLYSYLTTDDTSAILLLLFKRKNFELARTNAHKWLTGVDGYLGQESSAVEGWPLFLFSQRQRTVRVCVASVDVWPGRPTT